MTEVGAGLEEPTHGEIGKCHNLFVLRLSRRGSVGPEGHRKHALKQARAIRVWDGRLYKGEAGRRQGKCRG